MVILGIMVANPSGSKEVVIAPPPPPPLVSRTATGTAATAATGGTVTQSAPMSATAPAPAPAGSVVIVSTIINESTTLTVSNIKLDIPFSQAGAAGTPERDAFITTFTRDLAATMGIDPSRITVVNIRPGSIITDIEILPAPTTTISSEPTAATAAANLIIAYSDTNSLLYQGTITSNIITSEKPQVTKIQTPVTYSIGQNMGTCPITNLSNAVLLPPPTAPPTQPPTTDFSIETPPAIVTNTVIPSQPAPTEYSVPRDMIQCSSSGELTINGVDMGPCPETMTQSSLLLSAPTNMMSCGSPIQPMTMPNCSDPTNMLNCSDPTNMLNCSDPTNMASCNL